MEKLKNDNVFDNIKIETIHFKFYDDKPVACLSTTEDNYMAESKKCVYVNNI